MTKLYKVSVVLSIYNVEKYLDRCIESIVNQSYKNIEIILVDDGSKDSCPKICDDWAKKDNRIKVIHKENGGLGFARNTGIENATGDYIFFIDSDDYVELNMVEKCIEEVNKNNSDIICYGYNDLDCQTNKIQKNIPNVEKNIFENDEIKKDLLPNMLAFDPHNGYHNLLNLSACMAMFSLKLIKDNKWFFVSERIIISEDVYSLFILYQAAQKISVIKDCFYYYCKNDSFSSLTHTYREDRFEKIKYFYYEMTDMMKKYPYFEQNMERLNIVFFSYLIAALKIIVQSNTKNKIKKFKHIVKDELVQEIAKKYISKYDTKFRKLIICFIKKRCTYLLFILVKTRCFIK